MRAKALIVLVVVFILALANNTGKAAEPEDNEASLIMILRSAREAGTTMKNIFFIMAEREAKAEAAKEAKVMERQEDINLLAEVMYHENHCNGKRAMELTGSVVLNRVADPDYPDTVRAVLYQKGQYATVKSFYTERIPDYVYDIAEDLIDNGSKAPSNVVFQAMFKQGTGIYEKIKTDYFCYK